MNILSNFFACVRRQTGFFIFLIIMTILAIVFGVIAAINFDGAIVTIDLANIVYIKFLKGSCGVAYFMFGSILAIAVYFIVIILCCCRRFLYPLAILFYLYLIYSQAVVFVSIILIYGIFNVLILLIFLIVYIIMLALIFMLIITDCLSICDSPFYLKTCFSMNSNILIYSISLVVLSILFCLIVWVLKAFILLLVY